MFFSSDKTYFIGLLSLEKIVSSSVGAVTMSIELIISGSCLLAFCRYSAETNPVEDAGKYPMPVLLPWTVPLSQPYLVGDSVAEPDDASGTIKCPAALEPVTVLKSQLRASDSARGR